MANLDVYKRQAVQRALEFAKKDGNTLVIVTADPVSYTHLDVYKRQVMNWV